MEYLDNKAWIANNTGKWMVEQILDLAAWLTGEGTPGWISLAFLATLVVLSIFHGFSAWRFHGAVGACRSFLRESNGRITGAHLINIDRNFNNLKEKVGSRHRLGVAWEEFRETTVNPEHDTGQLHNTERPTLFFAREELGLERGIWRQVPALFVSVGLFLTFLGLVAALDQTSQILDSATANGDGAITDGLKILLRIAGAKFIMSLTGLFCSIIFTLVLRYVVRRTDDVLHSLCTDIEKGCTFMSEQKLLGEMLQQTKEQTDHLKSFSAELVAQIAKPLREELPETIRAAIAEAMAPAIANLSRSTGEGIELMAGSVSTQLAEGIQSSVQAMNDAIGNVSSSLEVVTERLDKSASAMGGQIDGAVQALAQQIGDLETAMAGSSKEAARAFNEATESMLREMNESLKRIGNTSNEGAHQIGNASREMASGIASATTAIRDSLVDPMSELVERIGHLASIVEITTGKVEKYADSVENSAIAVVTANEELERSTQTLATATAPVRDAVVGIETASRTMGDRVESASKAIRGTTEHTEAVLRGTREAIEASRITTQQALGSLQNAVVEFKNIIGRYDEIDRKLGNAFHKIDTEVRFSIDEIGEFERKLNKEFGEALNRLQAVITQIEPFTPRPKG